MKNYIQEYNRWLEQCSQSYYVDQDIIDELNKINGQEDKIEDAFYKDLTFGTGGLRAVIGAGTNRLNVYTVAKATQGLANYINSLDGESKSVAVSYDSRIKSDLFAKVTCSVLAANGIKVHIFKKLMPTPCLSYAVRQLHCDAGVMITASHNPAEYNGYKVYGSDGCQITTEAAKAIFEKIEKVDIFDSINFQDYLEGIETSEIMYIDDSLLDAFVDEVKSQSVLYGDHINRNCKIVYTPLNGTGLKPVMKALKESGYHNITVVKEQEKPDGNFPTCPFPNPEVKDAMKLGIEYAQKEDADLLIATDPDCDRCGIAVKDKDGQFRLLTANETGLILFDYICKQRIKHNMMPDEPVMMKTIVTNDLAEKIANHYSVKTINVLTGFKFIGEQIGKLEEQYKEDSYIFGFEESYGYLTGTYVRDKDGVNAVFMISEMYSYYQTQGISLLEQLENIYKEFGYCLTTQHTYKFEGSKGHQKMMDIMDDMRSNLNTVGDKKVLTKYDYLQGLNGLPKSNVLKFILEENCSLVVRPSGTEPKLKTYFFINATTKQDAVDVESYLNDQIKEAYI